MIDDLPPVMTIRSFSEIFMLDQSTTRRMIKRGELGAIQSPTGMIRILKDHVREWVKQCDLSSCQNAANGTSDGPKTARRDTDLQAAKIVQLENRY